MNTASFGGRQHVLEVHKYPVSGFTLRSFKEIT